VNRQSKITSDDSAINVIMVNPKRSSCFAITIGPVDWSKTDFGNYFCTDNYCSRIVVGCEPYHPPLDADTGEPSDEPAGYHHHIFLHTVEKWLLNEIKDHLLTFVGLEYDGSINIQTCRSPKSWILYITKEDKSPFLFGVRISECSLFARAWHHARTKYRYPQNINKCDEFIVSCGQNSRFAIGIIEEHINDLRIRKANARPLFVRNSQCELSNELFSLLEGDKHLYIYGEPGYGKTEVVDSFLCGKRYWKAGEPSMFLLGTIPDDIDYIWFEDFKLEKYLSYLQSLLSIMDKKEITISRKYMDDTTKLIKAKFIFCSNYLFDETLYSMFFRRLCMFHVEHKMYTCTGCGANAAVDEDLIEFHDSMTSDRLLVDLQDHLRNERGELDETFSMNDLF